MCVCVCVKGVKKKQHNDCLREPIKNSGYIKYVFKSLYSFTKNNK